jgi:hypothetical protein
MHVKAGVRSGEHAGGLVLVEELQTDKVPEHGAAERLMVLRDGPFGRNGSAPA